MYICRDVEGNSAVHGAAQAGFTETLTVMLNIHNFLMDAQNKLGVSTCLDVSDNQYVINSTVFYIIFNRIIIILFRILPCT